MPSPTNTTRFVALTLIFVLAWNFTSSLVGWGWLTATVISFAMTSVYTWYVRRHHESYFIAWLGMMVLIIGAFRNQPCLMI